MNRILYSLLAVAVTTSIAQADTLSGTLTADNNFSVYVSTDPFTLGSPITSGTNWQTSYSFSGVSLTPGTYYIQIVGTNFPSPPTPASNPAGVLGDFKLNSTSILTDSSWSAYGTLTGTSISNLLGPAYGEALNSDHSIWYNNSGHGSAPGIDGSAYWIWGDNSFINPNDVGKTEVFVSPQLVVAPTPEPESLMLLGSGLLALSGLVARRRRAA